NAYLAQARANRFSGRQGRRFDSLDSLAKAAAIRVTPELRNEAIAALALSDVQVLKKVAVGLPEWSSSVPDEEWERYATMVPGGEFVVRRMVDDVELLRLPTGPANPSKASAANHPLLLAFSHQGRFLAARERDGMVNVWNLETRTAVKMSRSSGMSEGFSFDFSP